MLVTVLKDGYLEDELPPLPIEVQPCHVAPRTSMDNSIGIHHGNKNKIKAVEEILVNPRVVSQKISDKFLCDKGANSLTRMLPGQYENQLLISA